MVIKPVAEAQKYWFGGFVDVDEGMNYYLMINAKILSYRELLNINQRINLRQEVRSYVDGK